MGDKLFIYLLLNIIHKILFIYKSCAWKKILANHHKIVIQFYKSQKKKFKLMYIFGRKIYLMVYVIESTLRMNLIFFPFGKISIKYERLKLMFVQCLQSNVG